MKIYELFRHEKTQKIEQEITTKNRGVFRKNPEKLLNLKCS
jgi:hypothetical protein